MDMKSMQELFSEKAFVDLLAYYDGDRVTLYDGRGEEVSLNDMPSCLFFIIGLPKQDLRKSGSSKNGEQIINSLESEYGLRESKVKKVKEVQEKLKKEPLARVLLFGKGDLDEIPTIDRVSKKG